MIGEIVFFIIGFSIGIFIGITFFQRTDIKYVTKEVIVDKEVHREVRNVKPEYAESTRIEGYEDLARFKSMKIESRFLKPLKDLEDTGNMFFKKKVVISGVFDDFYDRNILAQKLWEVGADIDASVGKKTQFLIIGDDAGPSKIDKANANGAVIIDQYELPDYFEDYEDFIVP